MFTNDSGIFCLLKIVYTVESNLMYQESKQGDINLAIQKKLWQCSYFLHNVGNAFSFK